MKLKKNKDYCEINKSERVIIFFLKIACVIIIIAVLSGSYIARIENITEKIKKDKEFIMNAEKELKKLRNTTYSDTILDKLSTDKKENIISV